MNPKAKKLLINIAKLLITAFAIWFVLHKIDVRELVNNLRAANWFYLIIALTFFVASKALSSFRLNIFFRNIELNISERQNLKLYLLGMFYNLFLPGGIGGDAYKVYLLHKARQHSVKELTAAVLLDRINGVVAIMILTLLLAAFMPLPAWMRWCAPFAIIVGYVVYCVFISLWFKKFKKSVHVTTVYSIGVQALQCVCVLFILLALHIHSNYFAIMFVFMLSSIVAALPFTIGGIGSREVVFVVCSQWLNIDAGIAVTVSLLFYIITAFTSFWGIYYSFRTDKILNNGVSC